MSVTHWMYKTKLYYTYDRINGRCNRVNNDRYHDYWGRWIKCLWYSFEDFKEDMYESYLKHVELHWEDNTSIDRIDNDWDYCKDNCRWSTNKEQSRNKRSNKNIIYKGENMCITDFCSLLWIPKSTFIMHKQRKEISYQDAVEYFINK